MNEQISIPVLIFGGFLILMVIIARLAAKYSRKAHNNLCELSQRLNLKMQEVKPVLGYYQQADLNGEIRGKQVRLYIYTTGTSKSKTTWAAILVVPREHGGLTFSITRQGFGSRVKALFGAEEIKVGDEKFDREWFIETNAPDFLAAGLLLELQQKIQPHHGNWKLKDGSIIYSEQGSFADRERCTRFIAIADAACDLADVAEVYAKQKQ
ncbi:MAG: hypothetical protein CMI16_05395 [Opitutaceae bacterium]|nr:hypothetical protein [Opitutaceae bacterium]|tara:strand:- start:2322 stop:2951 length:630 start_codon:yes stop_codon:yes gene_type:complete